MPSKRTFKVAIGDGFAGDVINVTAVDEDDATAQAEAKIAEMGNADWRVLGVK